MSKLQGENEMSTEILRISLKFVLIFIKMLQMSADYRILLSFSRNLKFRKFRCHALKICLGFADFSSKMNFITESSSFYGDEAEVNAIVASYPCGNFHCSSSRLSARKSFNSCDLRILSIVCANSSSSRVSSFLQDAYSSSRCEKIQGSSSL